MITDRQAYRYKKVPLCRYDCIDSCTDTVSGHGTMVQLDLQLLNLHQMGWIRVSLPGTFHSFELGEKNSFGTGLRLERLSFSLPGEPLLLSDFTEPGVASGGDFRLLDLGSSSRM